MDQHEGREDSATNQLSAGRVDKVVQIGTVRGDLHVHSRESQITAPRQLPSAPGLFTGRTNALAELDHIMPRAAATMVVSSIAGAGGIGKTWLVLHWAHRNLHRFPDGQLFIDLRGYSPDSDPMPATAAASAFLMALGVAPDRIPEAPHAQAALFRGLVAGRRMLIVLDNAAGAEQVLPLLPGDPSCTVLVTSRRVLTTLIRHGAHHLRLDPMTSDEARELLGARIGQHRVRADPVATEELIQFCRGYPLALGILAARAHIHTDIPLSEFVIELRELGVDALDDTDPTDSLPAVLSWSYRSLTDDQREAFCLLAIAPGPDTGLPAAVSVLGLPSARVTRLLRHLEEASLLTRPRNGRYAMHDLIRGFAVNAAQHLPDHVADAALRRAVDFYLHTAHLADGILEPRARMPIAAPAPGVRPHPVSAVDGALDWLEAEHEHLVAAQQLAAGRDQHLAVWQLAWLLATFHDRRGHRLGTMSVRTAALSAAAHLPDPVFTTRAHRVLGRGHTSFSQYDLAKEHISAALALAEQHGDQTELAHTCRELAWVHGRQGEDERALEYATRSLELYRGVGQPVWLAEAMNQVAAYTARLGDHDTAREHCRAALALQPRHNSVITQANILATLGLVDHEAGRYDDAIEHYGLAVELHGRVGSDAQVARSLERLGHLHLTKNDPDRARRAWQRAHDLYEQVDYDEDVQRVQAHLDSISHNI